MLWNLSPVYCTVTSAQKYMKPSLIQGRAHRKEILPQAHHFHRHHVGTLLVGVGPRVDAGERKYADGFLPEKATTKRVWTKDPAGPRSRHRQLCLDELQNKRKISVSVGDLHMPGHFDFGGSHAFLGDWTRPYASKAYEVGNRGTSEEAQRIETPLSKEKKTRST